MIQQIYPNTRLRRIRKAEWSRRLVAENALSRDDLIWPVFIHDSPNEDNIPISAMPGVFRYSLKSIPNIVKQARNLGIPALAFFPHISNTKKDSQGSEATNASNIVCKAIRAAKSTDDSIGIICDVALDPFTNHGHDGILDPEGYVLNDETIEMLIKQAINQAKAGCDVISPSDMMDGRIGLIRQALENEGFKNTQIMSYAAKYASNFYGPFREAIGSSELIGKDKKLGFRDKTTYQMSSVNSNEALREVAIDITEGADSVLIKPGMPYLDIVQRISSEFQFPTFAYQVSGEYNILKNAVDNGVLHEEVILESLLAFKRAGACGVFTYFAPWIADKLGN